MFLLCHNGNAKKSQNLLSYSTGKWAERQVLSYMGYLVAEILKASFAVMKLIYTRNHRMEPLLVRFDTGLQSPAARAVLGNSITLTAGTITVEDRDGHLCVHTLDRPLAEGIENSDFQRLLLELERTDG